MNFSKEDFESFKLWLKTHLEVGPVTIIFSKNGSLDEMTRCTHCIALIPQNQTKKLDKPKKNRKLNDENLSVYDLDQKSWRNIKWDSIKQVNFVI